MQIIILTSDYHLAANIGLRALLESSAVKRGEIQVLGIVMAQQFSFKKRDFKKMFRFIERSGFLFFAKSILSTLWSNLKISLARHMAPQDPERILSIEELAKRKGIPFLRVESINNQMSQAFILEKEPTLLVSCFLLEMLKTNILKLAPLGAINVHPALVQKHRGTFSAFWSLLKGWRKAGATVHFINEGMDEGAVILQKRFFVHPSDSLHRINKKAAELGGRLLAKALMKIKKKEEKGKILKKLGAIFSMPHLSDIERFYAKGKKLITTRELFGSWD